jgi:hypothetical protein
MEKADSPAKISKINKIEKFLSMTANLVVIAGIFVAVVQVIQMKKTEKSQNAINAINQTRSGDFLKAYARLKTVSKTQQVENATELVDDLNYVMNVYDHIALLYINNLADKCIIKHATYSATKELSVVCDAMAYPKEYRGNFDKFLALMEVEVCK